MIFDKANLLQIAKNISNALINYENTNIKNHNNSAVEDLFESKNATQLISRLNHIDFDNACKITATQYILFQNQFNNVRDFVEIIRTYYNIKKNKN